MSGLYETIVLIAGALILGCAVTPPTGGHQQAEEWQKVEIKGRFSFYIPPEMKRTSASGIDSLVGEYRNSNISLSFDYGWYSDSLDYGGRTDYEERFIEVDGRKAKLVTFSQSNSKNDFTNFAGIHFANPVDGQDKLTMWARYQNQNDLNQIKKVFQSIKFL